MGDWGLGQQVMTRFSKGGLIALEGKRGGSSSRRSLNGVLPHSLLKLGSAESVLAEIITTTTKKEKKKKDKKKENTVTFGNFNRLKEDNLILDHNWEIFWFIFFFTSTWPAMNRQIGLLDV